MLRSVDREVIGRNASERISPEIERVVRWPTLSLTGEGHISGLVIGKRPLALPGSRTCGMLPSGFV